MRNQKKFHGDADTRSHEWEGLKDRESPEVVQKENA